MRPAISYTDPTKERADYVSALVAELTDYRTDCSLTEAVNYLLTMRGWPPRVLADYLPEAFNKVEIFHRTLVDNHSAAA
jgi:hypothetical protein